MEQRTLGKSDLKVSAAGLGCNNFGFRVDLATARQVVDKAIALGITLFDTADTYGEMGGSEKALGEILGPRRKQIVLATKFAKPMDEAGRLRGASRRYIMSAVEASLSRLKTDWIDLYQQHEWDAKTPLEETLRALDDLIRQGKVRYIGCSNFAATEVEEAMRTARQLKLASFICCQDEYSLLVRGIEREQVPVMRAHGLGLLPFFPLASGLLTGKYRREAMPAGARLTKIKRLADRFATERNWKIAERLREFAEARGHTLLDLAFSWLLQRPCVASVIAGATSAAQIEQNVRAAGWRLTPAEMKTVDELTAS